MKKKLVVLCLAAVLAVSAFLFIQNRYDNQNDLLLANVEALADGEYFTFNGQEWNKDYHLYNEIGEHWCPQIEECQISVSVSIGYVLGVSYSETINGQRVQCVTGTGNCFDGTGCIRL